ncbi:SpoIID/LytB domain-containing protein [Paenibacillus sp. 79R4]|uniref:SpoIID/LytB domain-containing protein n=1 Tax=Paenibacillus sp. 79R4 TaxID=2212847 RepID=UPI0035631479
MKEKKTTFKLLKWGRGILAGVLLAGALQLPVSAPVSADDWSGNRVRVAMFLDLGSTYKLTVPAVTLKPGSAMDLVLQTSFGANNSLLTLDSGQTVRFSAGSNRIKAAESSDWKAIAAAVKKLQGTADRPVAYAVEQSGGTVYQIYTGPYASAAEAKKAVSRVSGSLSGVISGQAPSVKGGYYYSAGALGSKSEAEALRNSVSAAGVDAYLVLIGQQQYTVWAGGAASESELSAVRGSLPQASWSQVDDSEPGVIVQQDVTLNLNSPSPVDHYELRGTDSKLIVNGDDTLATQVVERSGRNYRGSFEISQLNGQLALVNELPLEKYLYSVVSGEVPASWPQESLKAQAVAARSYALYSASTDRFKVAGLIDTTLSQVYNGVENEKDSIIEAVDSTAGEVIKSNGKIVEAIFSSNSGGVSADSSEVWSSVNPTFSSVNSEWDKAAQAALKSWYYVLLPNGKTGYVREDNTKLTGGTTAAGLKKLSVTTSSVAVRPLPQIQSDVDPVAKLNPGDEIIILDKVDESSTYAWIRGPFTSDQLVKSLSGKTSTPAPSSIYNMEVTQRGPSGRVTQIKANGQILDVKYPDAFRSALGSLPSTLFDIKATGRYTVLGASGATTSGTAASGTPVLTASGQKTWSGGNMVVMDGDGVARVVDQSNQFLFVGRGNGHGLGLSQWGAKGMADAGYDYQKILQHYYQNVTIVKE